MSRKDLLKDCSISHLMDCGQYLHYPKDNISPFKILPQKRNGFNFQEAIVGSAQLEGGKKKRISLGKRKGKEQVKGPQELDTSLNEFVEVRFHENCPPIVDLSGPLDFTPSKPSQIAGASTFLLATPINFLYKFQSVWTTPHHPSPIFFPSIWPPRWQYIVFPFSQANIVVEKHSSTKRSEEYDQICAFIHEVIHRQFILAFSLFLFNSLLCFLHLRHLVQVNLENKVNFIFVDILGNLPIPLVSSSPKVFVWNKQDEDYVVSISTLSTSFWPLTRLCFFSPT